MVALVQSLLMSHNCVIIPGFGAFIGNYKPSEARLDEHKIYPPNKQIAFNASLQVNDALLCHALMQREQLNYAEAEAQVMAFSRECQRTLQEHKSLVLTDIGRLTLDAEGKLSFQPYATQNYLPDSYGLPVLSLEPIQRLAETAPSLQEAYQRVMHPEAMEDAVSPVIPQRRWYHVSLVAAVVLFGAILAFNLFRQPLSKQEASLVPAIQTQPKAVEQTPAPAVEPAPTTERTDSPAVADVPAAQVAAEPQKPTTAVAVQSASTLKSYVVVGAFFDQAHADRIRLLAESKGFQVNVGKHYDNTLYRVSLEVDPAQLESTMVRIRSEINPRAWVSCHQCVLP